MSNVSFNVDFDGLRQNVVNAYNELTVLLAKGKSPLDDVTVDGYDLEDALGELKNSIVWLCAVKIDGRPALTELDSFHLEQFEVDTEEEA